MALPFVPFISKLDAPLLKLDRLSDFNLDSATKGVHVFGGIGSGKTSGSGKNVGRRVSSRRHGRPGDCREA